MQTRASPSMSVLRSLARQAGMEDNSLKSSKIDLYHQLQSQYDIQRLERARNRGLKRLMKDECDDDDNEVTSTEILPSSSSSSSSLLASSPSSASSSSSSSLSAKTPFNSKRAVCNKTKRKLKKNKKRVTPLQEQSPPVIDPVMLDLVPEGAPKFVFTRPNGSEVVFLASSLADYLLSTGDFVDPESRLPFSNDDLAALDHVITEHKLGRESVLKAKLDPDRFSELRFRRDALSGLERCAGEIVSEMSQVAESGDLDQGQMILAMSLFPSFEDLYKQIHDADPEYAHMCMDHFISFLKGPPNRRAVDVCGLLQIILSFLSQVQKNRG